MEFINELLTSPQTLMGLLILWSLDRLSSELRTNTRASEIVANKLEKIDSRLDLEFNEEQLQHWRKQDA